MAASTSKPGTISATALHHYRGLNWAPLLMEKLETPSDT